MLKSAAIGLSLAALGTGVAVQQADAQQMEMPEPQTITAEVVDLACYVSLGLKGEGHKECAQVCADQGVALGFLGTDGNVYMAAGKGMPSVGQTQTLRPHAAATVRVTGAVMERGGARHIVIDKIEPAR